MLTEENSTKLVEEQIAKLEWQIEQDEVTKILEMLYDVQRGELSESAHNTMTRLWEKDHCDKRVAIIERFHKIVLRARKIGPGPIGESSPIMLRNAEEDVAIKAAGGYEQYLKSKVVDYAGAALNADKAYFIQRLRHNFFRPVNSPLPLKK